MTAGPCIAIDAMGGDVGPAAIVAGAARARRKDPALTFHLYGDEVLIAPEIATAVHRGFTASTNASLARSRDTNWTISRS